MLFVDDMKQGGHRLIIGDTLGIGAFCNAAQLVRHQYLFLFHHFIVADNVQLHIGSHNGQAAYFLVGKVAVGYLYNAFLAQFLALKVISDGNVGV